jgi:hypothetical protein
MKKGMENGYWWAMLGDEKLKNLDIIILDEEKKGKKGNCLLELNKYLTREID